MESSFIPDLKSMYNIIIDPGSYLPFILYTTYGTVVKVFDNSDTAFQFKGNPLSTREPHPRAANRTQTYTVAASMSEMKRPESTRAWVVIYDGLEIYDEGDYKN
jgi:hypothetical protein